MAAAEAMWAAADVGANAYRTRTERHAVADDRRVEGLPADDRWFVVGGGRLGRGVRPAADVLAAVEAHLRAQGYAVEHLRDQDTAGRVLRATGDDVAVVLTVEGDGIAVLDVYAGPAAVAFAALPPGRFVSA